MIRDVLFAIVHHADVEMTVVCLESIAQNVSGGASVDIRIADNSGRQSDFEGLSDAALRLSQQPGVAISVLRCENVGYFPSANHAVRQAPVAGNYRYVLVCNNDLVFASDFVSSLVVAEYPADCMAIYPDLVSSDGTHENPRVRNRISFPRMLAYHVFYSSYAIAYAMRAVHSAFQFLLSLNNAPPSSREPKEIEPILLGVGACVILSCDYFDSATELPGDVFLFGEEALLTRDIHRRGGKVFYDPSLRVRHEEHSSVGKMPKRSYWEIQKASARRFLPALWEIRRGETEA